MNDYIVDRYTPSPRVRAWVDGAVAAANSLRGNRNKRLRRINARYLADIAPDLPAEARERAMRTIANLEG